MNEKEKNAIEYLKTRLYGNECCKYIDIAQEDLRIFVNLIDQMKKNINSLEKYSDEQEENIIEKNNNICNLEFQIEKLQKENELTKQALIKNCNIADERNQLLKENEKLKNKLLDTLEGQKVIEEETTQYIKENYIPKQKIKDKVEELYQQDRNWSEEMSEPDSNFKNIDRNLKRIKNQIDVLQELIEESEEK